MKKTTMLIALLLVLIATATKAQSVADIQDTISAYAPHVPHLHRWSSADGKKFWGLGDTKYTHESQDTVISWISTYGEESENYYNKVAAWLGIIDPSTLSDADKERYYDVQAVWIMIHAND